MIRISVKNGKLNIPLKGVNIEGMEYWGVASDLIQGRNETEFKYSQIKALGFNCIRHPFAVDLYNYSYFYPNGYWKYVDRGYTGDLGVSYRQLMFNITQWCQFKQLYVFWEPHRWNHDIGDDFNMQDMSIYLATMRSLATMLKAFPNSIIELANEPQQPDWYSYAQQGITAIRDEGYIGLIVVPLSSSIDEFIAKPLIDPLNNLAYDIHLFWYYRQWWPVPPVNSVNGILNCLASVKATQLQPLMIGEFGAFDQRSDEIEFMVNMVKLCNLQKWGWMYWDYDLDSLTRWGMLSDWNTLNLTGRTLVDSINVLPPPVAKNLLLPALSLALGTGLVYVVQDRR